MNNILLLEDDMPIATGIIYSLEQENYTVTHAANVAMALDYISHNREFCLAILDLTLPDGSGYDVCKKIRSLDIDIPIIFLSACDEEVNIVMGLDMGADDYITKPFRVRELLSRINSVLRRYEKISSKKLTNIINIQDISVNLTDCKVSKSGLDIELTALEYKLFLSMATNPGQIFSRNQLLSGIWDINGDYVNDNTLTVYIKRLRDKLENDPSSPVIIETVRGLGYRINA